MKYIIYTVIVVFISFLIYSSVLAQEEKSNSCLIFLNIEFLKTGDVGDISVDSNNCFGDLRFEHKAFELARKIKFDSNAIDGKLNSLTRKVRYNFKYNESDLEQIANRFDDFVIVEESIIILFKPVAAYPKSDGGTVCMRGVVRLKVAFLSDGEIGEISVVSGLPYGANENAIRAARKMKFVPMKRDGIPISVRKSVVFNFSIY